MMRRRVFAALAGCAFALVAVGAEPVPPIAGLARQRMADEAVIRGEFEQRKTIKGFRNPLVSRGDFLVAREHGGVWRTRQPFASVLVITRERLLSRLADGTVTTRLSAREEPGLRAINEMLFALTAADLPVLAQRFRIEGELLGADRWRLVLVPRDDTLRQWVTRVELEGDRFLRTVRLQEAQGDETFIRFSRQSAAASLTRDEESSFE
jgi:hypothetical protein